MFIASKVALIAVLLTSPTGAGADNVVSLESTTSGCAGIVDTCSI